MHAPSRYWFKSEVANLTTLVFSTVFRTTIWQPGFALLTFGEHISSEALRRFMVSLKDALSKMYEHQFGHPLAYLSLARFDQQTTTKFHLDGAPETSFLMLGYEPSDVDSHLCIADFSRAAMDLQLTPRQFLQEYNPMFSTGDQVLQAYTTSLVPFDPKLTHILLINNSFAAPGRNRQLGVMHQAQIVTPCPERRRVINSTMIGLAGVEWKEPMTQDHLLWFQSDMPVAQGSYT